MTALQRVIVITEQGRIVGTQIDPGDGRAAPVATARLSAAPGQTVYEVQAAVPADLSSPGARESFHESLTRQISAQK